MGYPGDQGKPGGWPSAQQPPQEPYAPGAEWHDAASHGTDKEEAPFAPRGEAPGGPGGMPPVSWDEEAAGRTAPAPGGGFGPPSFGAAPAGPQDGEGVQVAGSYGLQNQDGSPYNAGGGFGNGGFEGGGFGDGSGPTPPRRKRNLPLIIGGSLVAGVVLIGGGFGAAAMLKDDPKPKDGAKSPVAATSKQPKVKAQTSAPPLKADKLGSRATDPTPLSLKEAFGKSAFSAEGKKYTRTGWKADPCTGAVSGAKLVATVKKAGCSQALRATYVRSDGKLLGTVGVLNLKTEKAAKAAEKVALAKDAYLKPLPGTGASKGIGKAEAVGTAQARGHYLVMTWVERPGGKKIPDSAQSAAQGFAQQIIKGSNLTFALAYRETEGKPFKN
ncbi:hypothetical protein [Actinomadura macrotermitis]|uniref:hypothetical protein n=1 Tax=Actinomadura macrotermitis TaxID=2585200 RepID=UPI001296721C|nr:hypothetical protein [Actinomadura macrotermitis]